MAEACGACCRSFLPNREINESLKCACQRPFFSQTVKRNNLPIDRDCWIEVPKRFVRHYSSSFGNTVNFEGHDGRSHCCSLVGSDIAIVGYGFEWYSFASSHNVRIGDQVVVTLMEKSRFLVQVYKADPQTVPLSEVKMEHDADDIQLAGRQDWLQAKARKCGINITVKVEQNVDDDLPANVDTVPLEAHGLPESNDEIAGDMEETDAQSLQAEAQIEDAQSEDAKSEDAKSDNAESENDNAESEGASASSSSSSSSDIDHSVRRSKRKMFGSRKKKSDGPNNNLEDSDDEVLGAAMSDDRSMRSPLYIQKKREFAHHWAEPGTTQRKTYVSKRRPVTSAEKESVLEAAKACQVSHNSYSRQLEKDNVYRALYLIIPAAWKREHMPRHMPVAKTSYFGSLVDEEGKSWKTRIRGKVIKWGNFCLDHRLEEDDVVVMELLDSRLESVKFLVHIFRVVDVRIGVRGKKGWADHYTIVDGKPKKKKLSKAQGKQKTSIASGRRLKRKRAHASSHLENSQPDQATKSRKKRQTRLQAALQSIKEMSAKATHGTVDSEHDSEDSLPLKHTSDSDNDGGPTPSGTDSCQRDCGPESSNARAASSRKEAGPSSKQEAEPSSKQEAESKSREECVVCWDAPVEAACIPCGHLAGCMDCLTKIKHTDWGCPVCRASIQQVVKVYAV